jgi:3'(2'), 5'-bisphosphate nucleotidase
MSETIPRIDAHLLDALTDMVSQAAAAILAIAPSALAPRSKADHSPVTAADEAADDVIAKGLARLLPGLAVVSEERAADAPALPLGASFVLVDPLDGTREFLAGRDEFTVNVAILTNGAPVAGIIAVPAYGLVHRGMLGQGAERLRLAPGQETAAASEATSIHCRPIPSDGIVATVSRSHLDKATMDFLARFPDARHVSVGSSIKFCRVAEGAADIYPRLAPIFEWDIAAGHAILAAAGGSVLTPDGGPLSYGRSRDGDFLVPGFIAWGDRDVQR